MPPEDIHAAALTLVKQGIFVRTTLAQRMRNHAASLFSCPPELLKVLAWGYASPNYAWTPAGFHWQARHGGWALLGRGG